MLAKYLRDERETWTPRIAVPLINQANSRSDEVVTSPSEKILNYLNVLTQELLGNTIFWFIWSYIRGWKTVEKDVHVSRTIQIFIYMFIHISIAEER